MQKTLTKLILFAMLLASCEKPSFETEANDFYHLSIEGTEIPVWVKGNTASRKFIVFINGGPGATSIDLASADIYGWSEILEKEVAMVYYDQRGCGNAQGNIDESTLTLEQYSKDLKAIIALISDLYDQPEIYLMGHSFGSSIATTYLLEEQPQSNVKAWISVDGAFHFDYPLSWAYRRVFLQNIANEEISKGNDVEHWTVALNWCDDNPVIDSDAQKEEWRNFVGWPGERIIPEELIELSAKQYLRIGFGSSYNAFPAYASKNLDIVNNRLNEDAEGRNFINQVDQITLPTLMIWGRYDDLITPEEGVTVFGLLGTDSSSKQFVLLPNSSHEPMISEPELFQTTVAEFVLTR